MLQRYAPSLPFPSLRRHGNPTADNAVVALPEINQASVFAVSPLCYIIFTLQKRKNPPKRVY
jgi:hypothetical protein